MKVGVALRKWAWHYGSVRGIITGGNIEVGAALRMWAWHYGSGRGITEEGVA
jgi:hypothetical protein